MYLKMSSTTRLLSDELKFFVMARAQEGDIYKEILEKVKKKNSKQISFGTITKILQKHGETDDIKNRWKGSSPQLFNAKETKSIVKAVKKNRLLTAVDVSANKKLNVHKPAHELCKESFESRVYYLRITLHSVSPQKMR